MTIIHAHSEPQFTEYLRSVLAEANGQPHSVDIAVGYFYLSGFTQVADLLATRPGSHPDRPYRPTHPTDPPDRPTREEITAGYSPRESAASYHSGQSRLDETAARDVTVQTGANSWS